MCGICASINFPSGQQIVRQMTASMLHRGPDGAGYFNHECVNLGMRRLSIIDLQTGDQPIYNEDRSAAIVFNGEIYNFQALYAELEALGHRFSTRSDTEAILHAYEEWGCDCPAHLQGMFTIIIFDGRPSPTGGSDWRVFVARDRLGIKPLYWYHGGAGLLFASEVRSLLASGQVERNLSTAGLYTYLAFGSLQEPLTLLQGVQSIPPASWLLVENLPAGLKLQQGFYWTCRPDPGPGPTQEQVHAWLQDAVGSHLVSEVPLGAFLSGGIDSGAILALGSQALRQPMQTFTLGFENWPADERELAGISARRWQSRHESHILGEAEILADLPEALAAMDQPSIDGINSWYVSREARKAGLTVALSGVGGDELFAGYPGFTQTAHLGRLPHLPSGSIKWPGLPASSDSNRKLLAYLLGDLPLSHPYFAIRGLLTRSQINALLSLRARTALLSASEDLEAWRRSVDVHVERAARFDAVGEISWLELSQYTLSTLLRDTDMMSMAHSLEVRVPFMDSLLVERILSVPGRQKLIQGEKKPLLTRALAGELPAEITSQAKRTFTLPFQSWLQGGLASQVRAELSSSTGPLADWIEPAASANLWRVFERGQTNWARPWSLYVLGRWCRNNL